MACMYSTAQRGHTLHLSVRGQSLTLAGRVANLPWPAALGRAGGCGK